MKKTSFLISAALFATSSAYANVSTFDNLSLAANSYYSPMTSTTFNSGDASFNYDFTDFGGGCCASGWTYSNQTDTTTAGFGNQYSSYAGGGVLGSDNYGVAFLGAPTVTFANDNLVAGAYFTNTTYAALSMKNGDSFAKKFGGASGSDSDFFKLTITGHNRLGATTGSVDFYLADYRFANSSQDYIVKDWTFVDLSSLGSVSSLSFALASSDNSSFGMNTPAYFAMDNLSVAAVPEPSQLAMLLAGGTALAALQLRRKK